MSTREVTVFTPPVYPQDRLDDARQVAAGHDGGAVDLSVGTPTDPPPQAVVDALAESAEVVAGYPSSIGSAQLRSSIGGWLSSTFGMGLPVDQIALCVGTKELVASVPAYLRLRYPGRDTVLYPEISYPTYEMGARLAGLRAMPVPLGADGRLGLAAVEASEAERALLLWSNSPGNPAGGLDDLSAAARWGQQHGVPVFSDECYTEFTWDRAPATILGRGGGDVGVDGVVAVHSLSKRSNMAGARVGWYSGDAELVSYLREVRKHAGLMVPGPIQRAAVAALDDGSHVDVQRSLYRERLERCAAIFRALGSEVELPRGGFYLWAPVPSDVSGGDWGWAAALADKGGLVVSPGSIYGPAGAGFVRVAMVAPLDRLDLVARRLGV